MKNLHEVWDKRLRRYTMEVQNYLKFIVTGHIAVVMLFAIGAAGYAYSEWVQNVPPEFPAALLMAVLFGTLLSYSPPVTLLKQADGVYLLPLESRLDEYLKPALRWTYVSQLYLPIVVFIVSLPLINALYGLPSSYLIGFPILLLLVKWWNVRSEFHWRKSGEGQNVWLERVVRFLLVAGFAWSYVDGWMIVSAVFLFAMIFYGKWTERRAAGKAFPYGHFIELEENRMLRFYQFANYFTDVPHLKGKVRERRWLNPVYRLIKGKASNAHLYLVSRTFIRSDELFFLWVRLTLIILVGAWLIPFQIAIALFAGALAFASTIQLWQGLTQSQHFRMDQLFPLSTHSREKAVWKWVIAVQLIQAVSALILLLALEQFVTALLIAAVIAVVSVVTLAGARRKSAQLNKRK
ncbi:ABC transporter permease [Planococcus plakortidis]